MQYIEVTGQHGRRALVNAAAIFAVMEGDNGTGCTVYATGDGVAFRTRESYEEIRDRLEQDGKREGGGGNGDGT